MLVHPFIGQLHRSIELKFSDASRVALMNNADCIGKRTEFYSFKHDILADQNNEKCCIQKTHTFYSFEYLKIFMVYKGYQS